MTQSSAKSNDSKSKKEETFKSKLIVQRYRDRLSVLRQAQEYSQKDDVPRAVQYYMKYLDSLAAFHEVEEKQLSPQHFHKDQGITEILLVSQVYWDLAKAYDRHPRLHKESERCMDQFVRFSLGFKFQYINSEILRKFIRKKMAYNPKTFEVAYERIRVNSKSCYVATYAYGDMHPVTQDLRLLKKWMLNYRAGHQFVDVYYRYSPRFVEYCENSTWFGPLSRKYVFRPVLGFIAKIVRRLVT